MRGSPLATRPSRRMAPPRTQPRTEWLRSFVATARRSSLVIRCPAELPVLERLSAPCSLTSFIDEVAGCRCSWLIREVSASICHRHRSGPGGPMSDEIKGGDPFIVDNRDDGWKDLRYLQEWTEIAKSFDIASGFFEIGSLLDLDGDRYPRDA